MFEYATSVSLHPIHLYDVVVVDVVAVHQVTLVVVVVVEAEEAEVVKAVPKSKNDAQQENILIDTRSKLKTELRTEKQNKRELKEELDGRFNDSSGAIKRFKSGDEDDDAVPFTDSQKETLEEFVDSEKEIVLLKKAVADNQKKMEGSSESNATA